MITLDLARLEERHIGMLDKISKRIRAPYNALVGFVTTQAATEIGWQMTSVASRDTIMSPLYKRCLHLELIAEILRRGERPDEIVVYSAAMKQVLEKYIASAGLKIVVRNMYFIRKRLKGVLRPFLRLAVSAYRLMKLYYYAAISRMRNRPRYALDKPVTLIDTFLLDSSFTAEGYSDRYYPGLLDCATEDEKAYIYYVPLIEGVSDYGMMFSLLRESRVKFLLKEDFLKLRDYAKALFLSLRVGFFRIKNAGFRGFDAAPLINEELRDNLFNYVPMLGMMNYLFAKRLKESGVTVRLVVDWFENQVVDKGINGGFRKYYPETPIVGYEGYIAPGNTRMHVYPTDFERQNGLIPTEIAVVGRGLIEPVKEFCADLKVSAAPAFRFRGVWDERKHFPQKGVYTVLICLPIYMAESVDILKTVAHAAGLIDGNVRYHVKSHPTHRPRDIKNAFGQNWPDGFEFVTGSFKECVEQCDVLIGNASSTCVEALAAGVPVIVPVSRGGLVPNAIPDAVGGDIWRLCVTPRDVSAALKFYMQRGEEKIAAHVEDGKRIRQEYFERVTHTSARKFLKLQ